MVLEDRDIDLIAAGIDVALRIDRLTDSAVTALRSAVVEEPWSVRPPISRRGAHIPADLLAHQAIIYEQRAGGATRAFWQGTSETTVTLSDRVRVSAAEGVREAVLAGLGVSIGGSEWLFPPELKSGAVKAVLTDWSLPPVDP